MKKVLNIILLLIVFTFLFTAYKYTVIRKGMSFYFMEKNPPTFQEIYVDVTDWTIKDYATHPKISAFLVTQGVKKKTIEIKSKVLETIEKHKEEMKKMIEEEEDENK
ncbi:hypothetical protein TTHT_1144 [Thermotomaculum hydrothermale]|uniref:Uncharacterized protein n=1 Tax=Thermotomaculum hydrothermale TaxID=981385 RepID=A0A7R6PP27_9BACT|nr:hypothetical protein [Thermotomaculum hydrothermale]BBB32676.1 hypothetical protein TTHT_1144 [Thermotomaculum hydrothermale]